MKKKMASILVILMVFALSFPCGAETLRLTADKDTYIDQIYPVKNFGQSWNMLTSGDTNKYARGVFHFNTNMLPEGALIQKATITFLLHANKSTTTYSFYPLTTSWQEDTATWTVAEAGRNWTTPGGDYDQTTFVQEMLPFSTPDWMVIDVTSLVSDQEGHLKSDIAEYGILVKPDKGYNRILSSEFSSYSSALTCHTCHGTDPSGIDKGKSTNCASCHSRDGLPLAGEPTLIIEYQPMLLQFAQVSDIHIGKSSQQATNLQNAVTQLNGIHPAFVLFTGDLTDSGSISQYDTFKGAISNLNVPSYCVPGDNDIVDGEGDLQRYRDELGEDYYAFTQQGFQFIGLNDVLYLPLDETQRQWLEGRLQDGIPSMVFAHKSPLDYYNGYAPFADALPLLNLLDTYETAMFMNGHNHEAAEHIFNGTSFIWCDNLSYAHLGDTYNVYQVYSDHILVFNVDLRDGSRTLAGSFPLNTPPTLITLSSFEALPSDRMVTLRWTTESEVDNAGFNIYRSEGGDKDLKVNQEIIVPQGSTTQGAAYEFQDTQVENRKTYSYKLEDINIHGKSTFHGPVTATPRAIYSSNRNQVQVATDTSQFQPFSSPPRAIAFGPYSLQVTQHSALIVWEEMDSQDTLQHVEVNCAGLLPATEYFYSVNGSARDGRFVTAPAASSSPFSFFVWSDTQKGGETAQEVVDRMIAVDPDASFALHAGDLVNDGNSLESWETEWWGPIADLISYLPIYPVMGNHEADSEFFYRYFSPLVGEESNYSFDWGGTHIVMFNVVEEDSLSDEHLAWLTGELKRGQKDDLTIVCHHTPVYVSSPAVVEETTSLQEILVPLYEQYGVDVVFNGDFHGYQHHLKDGIHYVIPAGGGGKLYDYGLPLEDMTLQLSKSYNFLRCQVAGKHLYATAYNQVGEIIDNFKIEGCHPTSVTSSLAMTTSSSEVVQGGQFQVDMFLEDMVNLDKIVFSLLYSKDDPPVSLQAMDMDSGTEGVQIQKGDTGGVVTVNQADNTQGVISFQEENIAGLSSPKVKIASVIFTVPENANITAFYLVPQCILFDTAGREIPHFMGGAEVIIKAKAASSLPKPAENTQKAVQGT